MNLDLGGGNGYASRQLHGKPRRPVGQFLSEVLGSRHQCDKENSNQIKSNVSQFELEGSSKLVVL